MTLAPGHYVIPWDGKSESGEEIGTGVYYGQLLLEGGDDQPQALSQVHRVFTRNSNGC